MKSTPRTLVSVLLVSFAIAGPVFADWIEGDSYKMHYPQLPDLSELGMDVCAIVPTILADDFMCMEDGPITGIHIWGSWLDDIEDPEPTFVLSIHSDIPAGESPTGYSMPGDTLWLKDFTSTQFVKGVTIPGLIEGWYDPLSGSYLPVGDTMCFQYNFPIDTQDAFVQSSGTVYWLDVQYVPSTNQPSAMFGWKTAIPDFHWNDDAVWIESMEPVPPPPPFWNEMVYPITHPMEGISIDLAFVIDGGYTDDFGDAPEPTYPTSLASNGARHVVLPGYFMGAGVDHEPDGQPNATATGDDTLDGNDDEDGVNFTSQLIQGSSAGADVIVSGSGMLNAWVDFNADGDWADTGEQIFTNLAVAPITNSVSFAVPATATTGTTFARFRFDSAGGLNYDGAASDGEVEDYEVLIEAEEPKPLDFGDAPSVYPTLLASNGARHVVVPGLFLGAAIDPEPDGQPNATATGDDVMGVPDDEDGVVFTTPLMQGMAAGATVTASMPGLLSAWVDFNTDGDWADTGEQVVTNLPLAPGPNPLVFNVPATAQIGNTYSRFRYSTMTVSGYAGSSPDGEVEDYAVTILEGETPQELDFGDADDAPYPTLMANDGARHVIVSNVCLGATVDSEPDGQPDGTATGDDNLGAPDDEDGVILPPYFLQGQTNTILVIASVPGYLWAWIDFAGNGDWNDAGEQIFNGQALAQGTNTLKFLVPAYGAASPQSRFRFTTNQIPQNFTGQADNGEVEDYEVLIVDTDYGDAPAPYPTMYANNGALHILGGSLYLGTIAPDREPDGQPDSTATGDDLAGTPDDGDGAVPTSLFAPGNKAFVDVVASGAGLLSIWIDYNADGDWADTNELVAADVPLTTGTNNLSFRVPREVVSTNTFARLRFSSAGGLSYTGIAPDGEVEDYMISIEPPIEIALVDRDSSSNIVVQSVGYYGSGTIQILQASTNLLGTNWTDRATNASPQPPPQTNVWTISPAQNNEFYRIRQR